ncbi:hypothetical protein Arub01_17710 [Actinomadura rubrobrunea]|uniref:Uncharacterized protein n=1 Tax=Actinomadura rubrobrunea TaxID=115335 RepID=A0A9W6UVS1_9ACTN|nr:hypothetical protein [Actinomadura rubrobrunea]GLW63527.1 hypothetical protein Arub01_17710 [Actinomadura rubrobrunea]
MDATPMTDAEIIDSLFFQITDWAADLVHRGLISEAEANAVELTALATIRQDMSLLEPGAAAVLEAERLTRFAAGPETR